MCRAMLHSCRVVACLCCFAWPVQPIVRAADAADAADALPRYRFTPGQELVYELKSEKVTRKLPDEAGNPRPQPRRTSVITWNVFVVTANDDGSWRVVIRKNVKDVEYRSTDDKPSWQELARAALMGKPAPVAGEEYVRFGNVFVGWCDLHPDGRYEMNSSLGDNPMFEVQPEEVFCQLPADADALESGWKFDSPASGNEFQLQAAGTDVEEWEMRGRRMAPEDVVYQAIRDVSYRIDPERGVVDRITDDWQVKTSEYRRQAEVELVEVKQHDRRWMEKFGAEADAYVAAFGEWYRRFEEASAARTVAECKALLDGGRKLLEDGRASATLGSLIEAYDATIALHDRDYLDALQSAGRSEAFYAQPAIEWETTDFDGKPHRSKDFRGQVVVMDFWYRGCGHCIKAMPKVKRLAAKYEGRAVAVLGMSNDETEEDAQSVIDTMAIKYPVLRCGDLAGQYGVRSWPTFVVLDQSGRVALRVFGNCDNLEKMLSGVVDELLANPPE